MPSVDFVSSEEDLRFWASETLLVNHREMASYTISKSDTLILQINCVRDDEGEFSNIFMASRPLLHDQFVLNVGDYIKRVGELAAIVNPPKRSSIGRSTGEEAAAILARYADVRELEIESGEIEGLLVFDEIIRVISFMSHVMERSPDAFVSLDEESLRMHLLVHINGRWAGGAFAEAFNVSGKTDILVRRADRNLFVGECKVWRGPKEFLKAIDQLLSYLSCQCRNKTPAFLPVLTTAAAPSYGLLARLFC